MKPGQPSVGIAMHPHLDLHVMHAMPILRNLHAHPRESHTLVLAHHPLIGLTEDVIEIATDPGQEGRSLFKRRLPDSALKAGR